MREKERNERGGNYGRPRARDYRWCLKRRKRREGAPLFLPAGSRDDGVCPRGRSILRESWIACEYAAGRAEGGRDREEEEGRRIRVYRGAPGAQLAAARNAHLKRGRNGRGAPGVFLTRIPDVRASHLLILDSFCCSSRDRPVRSSLPFGFLILSVLFLFLSVPSFRLGIICRRARRIGIARGRERYVQRLCDALLRWMQRARRQTGVT